VLGGGMQVLLTIVVVTLIALAAGSLLHSIHCCYSTICKRRGIIYFFNKGWKTQREEEQNSAFFIYSADVFMEDEIFLR
jgi:hypothetical protein